MATSLALLAMTGRAAFATFCATSFRLSCRSLAKAGALQIIDPLCGLLCTTNQLHKRSQRPRRAEDRDKAFVFFVNLLCSFRRLLRCASFTRRSPHVENGDAVSREFQASSPGAVAEGDGGRFVGTGIVDHDE